MEALLYVLLDKNAKTHHLKFIYHGPPFDRMFCYPLNHFLFINGTLVVGLHNLSKEKIAIQIQIPIQSHF